MSTQKLVSLYTDFAQYALPTVSGLYSLYKKDYKGTAWLLFSVLVNQIGIEALKRVFNTKRPDGRKHSFPSGHTAAAFLGPCFFIKRYGFSPESPLVASSGVLASLTGLGRVWIKAHWVHDIIGGAFLGYVVTRISVPSYNL